MVVLTTTPPKTPHPTKGGGRKIFIWGGGKQIRGEKNSLFKIVPEGNILHKTIIFIFVLLFVQIIKNKVALIF